MAASTTQNLSRRSHIIMGTNGGHNNHKHHGHDHNGGNGSYKGNGNATPNNNGHHRPNTAPKKDLSHIICYNCKKPGHYSTECPEMKNAETAKPNPFDKGFVNPVHLEGAYNEPSMVNGTFQIKYPV